MTAMRLTRLAAAGVALTMLATACGVLGDGDDPLADLRPVSPEGEVIEAEPVEQPGEILAQETAGDDTPDLEETLAGADLVVDVSGAGAPFDRRLLGTNLAAWSDVDGEPWYYPSIELAGVEVLRFPGGSWSNHYSWLGCLDGTDECFWPWAMTIEDFTRVMSNLDGIEFIWTVHYNGTPEEAAGLVAFLNANPDDDTVIGVDSNGFDWQTAGVWAQRRVDLGFVDPIGVRYFEIGNEIYGAVADAGPGCADFGWENVATCDGLEYIEGIPEQAGFLEFAEKMKAVDPTIEVGAVGVSPVTGWGNFGNEVLAAGGAAIDFFIVHSYGFGNAPNEDRVLTQAERAWDGSGEHLAAAFAEWNLPDLEVAVTEYNLVAWHDADSDRLMNRFMNTFFLTQTIGQMALNGVDMAAQWNLLGVESSVGANYGLVHQWTGRVQPQLFSLRMWSLMGDTLRPVTVADDLEVYATSSADGGVQLLVLNPSAERRTTSLRVDGAGDTWQATADVVAAADLRAEAVTYNGQSFEQATDIDTTPIDLGEVESAFEHEFAPFSITVLRLAPS